MALPPPASVLPDLKERVRHPAAVADLPAQRERLLRETERRSRIALRVRDRGEAEEGAALASAVANLPEEREGPLGDNS